MAAILFVCTYNRYRSPLARVVFEELLAKANRGDVLVDSAGTWVEEVLPPSQEAFREASRRRLSLQGHLSKGIETLVLDNYDLILVMEAGQKEALFQEFPAARPKVFMLTEFDPGGSFNIPDPTTSRNDFREVADEIEDLLERNLSRILAWVDQTSGH